MMKWGEILRVGAYNLIHRDSHRLEHMLLDQMRLLLDQQILPTWENYKKVRHWEIVRKHLTLEEQFLYRCHYIRLYKATCPKPRP